MAPTLKWTLITTPGHFCTCHDRSAIVAYANFWPSKWTSELKGCFQDLVYKLTNPSWNVSPGPLWWNRIGFTTLPYGRHARNRILKCSCCESQVFLTLRAIKSQSVNKLGSTKTPFCSSKLINVPLHVHRYCFVAWLGMPSEVSSTIESCRIMFFLHVVKYHLFFLHKIGCPKVVPPFQVDTIPCPASFICGIYAQPMHYLIEGEWRIYASVN